MLERRQALFVCLACVAACGSPEPEAQPEPAAVVSCVALESMVFADEREVFGVVDTVLGGRAMVASELAGRILSLAVSEGDLVARGAPLAEVDRGVASDASRAASARVTEAELLASNARTTRDRIAHLVERGISARHELTDADSRLGELEAARDAARALSRESSRLAARGHVTAPIDGVVVRVLRHVGDTVDGTPATPILELADPSTRELSASAAPRDLLALAVGQGAQVFVDGLDLPLAGTVSRVAPALDPTTGTGSLRVALPVALPVDGPLPLGLSGRASIAVGGHPGLAVPISAVRGRRDGGSEVLRCEGGVAVAVEVELGIHQGETVEITSSDPALAPGERVVLRALGIEEGNPTLDGPEASR